MKKSLIAMALMFGAVVFVASCNDEEGGDDKTCKTCTISVDNRTGGVASKASAVYPNGEYCDANLTAVQAQNGQNVTGADATDGKGGKYTVSCQ